MEGSALSAIIVLGDCVIRNAAGDRVFAARAIPSVIVGKRQGFGSGTMEQEIDIDLPNRIEFRVNHEKCLIESNDPSIYMRHRGGIPEPEIKFFSLHWGAREIPARTRSKYKGLGRNTEGQNEYEVDWIVESIGRRDYAAIAPAEPYKFTSREEYICAANLITKGLQAFGGTFNKPEWNLFPVALRISAKLSEPLKLDIYGGSN